MKKSNFKIASFIRIIKKNKKILAKIIKPLSFFYRHIGLAFIISKGKSKDKKPTLFLWLISVYMAIFSFSVNKFEAELSRLQYRHSALAPLQSGEKSRHAINEMSRILNSHLPNPPRVLSPFVTLNNFFEVIAQPKTQKTKLSAFYVIEESYVDHPELESPSSFLLPFSIFTEEMLVEEDSDIPNTTRRYKNTFNAWLYSSVEKHEKTKSISQSIWNYIDSLAKSDELICAENLDEAKEKLLNLFGQAINFYALMSSFKVLDREIFDDCITLEIVSENLLARFKNARFTNAILVHNFSHHQEYLALTDFTALQSKIVFSNFLKDKFLFKIFDSEIIGSTIIISPGESRNKHTIRVADSNLSFTKVISEQKLEVVRSNLFFSDLREANISCGFLLDNKNSEWALHNVKDCFNYPRFKNLRELADAFSKHVKENYSHPIALSKLDFAK